MFAEMKYYAMSLLLASSMALGGCSLDQVKETIVGTPEDSLTLGVLVAVDQKKTPEERAKKAAEIRRDAENLKAVLSSLKGVALTNIEGLIKEKIGFSEMLPSRQFIYGRLIRSVVDAAGNIETGIVDQEFIELASAKIDVVIEATKAYE